MESYLRWLNDNQWLNLIFLSLALLSIFVSVYLYRKSKRKKIPLYDKRSINVISDTIKKIGEIDVTFRGSTIENLTVTKIAFWNGGNDTLNDSDQAPTDKLKITISEGYNILESEVIFQSSSTNNVRSNLIDNVINIAFDYLDQNEGGIIKFIHTGKKSTDINLSGTFKGASKLKRINSGLFGFSVSAKFSLPFVRSFSDTNKNKRLAIRAMSWILLVAGIMMGCMHFVVKSTDRSFTPFLIIGGMYFAIGAAQLLNSNSTPKGFDVFYDDE